MNWCRWLRLFNEFAFLFNRGKCKFDTITKQISLLGFVAWGWGQFDFGFICVENSLCFLRKLNFASRVLGALTLLVLDAWTHFLVVEVVKGRCRDIYLRFTANHVHPREVLSIFILKRASERWFEHAMGRRLLNDLLIKHGHLRHIDVGHYSCTF
jgi:hypothetical protein